MDLKRFGIVREYLSQISCRTGIAEFQTTSMKSGSYMFILR